MPSEHLEAYPSFGALLRQFRKNRKISQLKLALSVALDNSVISRFETGAYLPPSEDIVARLGDKLGLQTGELLRLEAAYRRDLLISKGVSPENIERVSMPGRRSHIFDLIELTRDDLHSIQDLRRSGVPHIAARDSNRIAMRLRKLRGDVDDPAISGEIGKLLALCIAEECKSYMDYVLPEDSWAISSSLVKELYSLAYRDKSPVIGTLAELCQEEMLYVGREYSKADHISRRVVQHSLGSVNTGSLVPESPLAMLDTRWQVDALRAAIINAGYLHDVGGVEILRNAIENIIELGVGDVPAEITFLLEGVGRAQSEVGSAQAATTLDKAWHVLERGQESGVRSTLRRVQLTRTYLRASLNSPGFDALEAERRGLKAKWIAEEMGYRRYEREIQELLDRLTNG